MRRVDGGEGRNKSNSMKETGFNRREKSARGHSGIETKIRNTNMNTHSETD